MVTLLQITVDHSAQDKLHFLAHTCLPQNCIFRNKNHQNPEHSITFKNTLANVSPHLLNKSGYQILQENHRAIYTVHLPCQFCTAENAVFRSQSTVSQSIHFTTALRTSESTQVSPFLSVAIERPFLMACFLKSLQTSPFTGDGLAGVRSKDLAMLSYIRKTFFHKCSPDSAALFGFQLCRCDVLFTKLWRNFCFVSFAHTQSTFKSKSAYFCLLCM